MKTRKLPHPYAVGISWALLFAPSVSAQVAPQALSSAPADTVELSLTTGTEGTVLRVRDDGTGFDSTRPAASSGRGWQGLGLRSMRERAESLGARFSIESAPDHGTVVAVLVPPAVITSKDES